MTCRRVDDLNARGLVTVPLYAGGKNTATRKAASANTEAARQDNAAVRNALGFEVSRAFYTVLKTRQFIRAAEAGVNSFEASLAVAKKRLDGGTLLKSGVLDIEVRLAQAREELVRARNANALAVRALRNLLGIESGEFEVADTAPAGQAPDSGDFSGRPELAAARHRERAAQEQVRAAKGSYLPRVNAFGSLDYDYGWKYDNGGGSYTAGALLQWDLWDGKLTRAKVRRGQRQSRIRPRRTAQAAAGARPRSRAGPPRPQGRQRAPQRDRPGGRPGRGKRQPDPRPLRAGTGAAQGLD